MIDVFGRGVEVMEPKAEVEGRAVSDSPLDMILNGDTLVSWIARDQAEIHHLRLKVKWKQVLNFIAVGDKVERDKRIKALCSYLNIDTDLNHISVSAIEGLQKVVMVDEGNLEDILLTAKQTEGNVKD